MTPLELLTTGFFVLAAQPVQCRVPKAPEIEVIPKTAPTAYDFSKSIEELREIKTDTISPYGQHVEQLVYGLHRGQMSIGYNIEFGGIEYTGLGLSCLYFSKVNVTLELNPVIYVVEELKPGTCAHRAVLQHEKKHVKTDRRVANKYAREIGLAVQRAVNSAGAVGPYRREDIPRVRNRMAEHISSTIKSLEFSMHEEQMRLQQSVDSMGEYDEVARQVREVCGYKPGR